LIVFIHFKLFILHFYRFKDSFITILLVNGSYSMNCAIVEIKVQEWFGYWFKYYLSYILSEYDQDQEYVLVYWS